MEELKLKKNNINLAFKTLEKAIKSYKMALKKNDILDLHKAKIFDEYQDFLNSLRDSMIQRFEYSVDMFWKFLKYYLENVEKATLERKSPKAIIRYSVENRLINEQEAKNALEMIDYRNQTSHIYKQEVADIISKHVPAFYELMISVIKRLK